MTHKELKSYCGHHNLYLINWAGSYKIAFVDKDYFELSRNEFAYAKGLREAERVAVGICQYKNFMYFLAHGKHF